MCISEMNLYQFENGYRYNSDSLFFYDTLRLLNLKGKILDVGCGCGILGLLIKKNYPNCEVDVLDFQEENIFLSQKNAEENKLCINAIHCDFLEYSEKNKYDFIISNPPFYQNQTKKTTNEHLAKSRYNGYLPFEKFAKKCYKILKDKGEFAFCYDTKALSFVLNCLENEKFGIKKMRFIYPKKDKFASIVIILSKKNSKSQCDILPPFITNDENGYTNDAKIIFQNTNTMSKTWKI